MALCTFQSFPCEDRKLLDLPTEIRLSILEYVFEDASLDVGFSKAQAPVGIVLDESYSANAKLRTLLTCRQMYDDGSLLGLRHTSFIVTNLFFNIPQRLAVLHPKQVGAIRNIAFVADARHFRKILSWGQHAFGVPTLRLHTLTIVLHRSSFWHYLFDFTADIVKLLRQLQGTQRIVFIRNNARVKGSFKTWYNRLVGLIMKVDHHQRYEVKPPCLEEVWWTWSFDEDEQSFCLEAGPPRPMVDESTYMQQMMPLIEELKIGVENEEWNPDPRSRNGA